MKYLGITLDAKLRFTHHILDKCNKAKQLLMLLKRAVGMYWGPPPIQMRWILTGMIRPMLTYGSLVWAQQAQKLEKVQSALRKVQRLAMITMGHFRRSTPTAGLEVIMD